MGSNGSRPACPASNGKLYLIVNNTVKETWQKIAQSQKEEGGVTLAQLNSVISNPNFKRKFERLLSEDLNNDQIEEIINEQMSYAERVEMARLFSVLSGETVNTPKG